ncbi:MAG: peptidyl-prolyl cis-trans isomerase [Candidatus Omnitrophota bacterium]
MFRKDIMGLLILGCVVSAGVFAGSPLSAQEGNVDQASAGENKGRPKDRVIAVIGEDKVYFSQVENIARGLNRFLRENFQTSKSWRLDFVRKYIAGLALAQRARSEGLDKDPDVLSAIRQAERDILANKVLSRRLDKININEDDLRKYYLGNKARYAIKEQIKLSYIKLPTKKAADKIIARINKGWEFERAAGKRAVKVGQWVSRDAMFIPRLENVPTDKLNALFDLGIGGTSQPIEVLSSVAEAREQKAKAKRQGEFYIFHIDEKKEGRDRPFEDVRRQIETEYIRKAKSDAINELIRETFRQEKVEIYQDKVTEGM